MATSHTLKHLAHAITDDAVSFACAAMATKSLRPACRFEGLLALCLAAEIPKAFRQRQPGLRCFSTDEGWSIEFDRPSWHGAAPYQLGGNVKSTRLSHRGWLTIVAGQKKIADVKEYG